MTESILKKLQTLQFRGQRLPYLSAGLGFQHESAQRKFIFRDQLLVQQLGRSNETLRYTLAFYDGLTGFGSAFSEGWEPFLASMRNREPGELIDPFLGPMQVVPVSVQTTFVPGENQSGLTVEAEFLEAPEIKEQEKAPSTAQTAKAAEAQRRKQFDRGDLPPDPEFTEPLVNPIQAVTGLIQRGTLIGQLVLSKGLQQIGQVERLIDAVDQADPDNWEVVDAYRNYLRELHKAQKPSSKLRVHITPALISTSKLASALGVSLTKLLELNPELGPMVPEGSTILYLPEAA